MITFRMILGALTVFGAGLLMRINPIVPAFILTLYLYFKTTCKNLDCRSFKPLHLTFLFVLIIWVTFLVIRNHFSVCWIPFASLAMLVVLLFNDLRIALLLCSAAAFSIGAIAGNNFNLAILFFVSGILGSIMVQDVRRRESIIKAGIVVGLANAVMYFFIEGGHINDPAGYMVLFLNGVFCSIIVIGVLPVFEYLFGTMTNISLLELADFHHPLLQRLIMEAPGTYHHSLIVGNLSEAACAAVGANSLLARIGAYYHDIGKLSKPGYFSENQYLIPKNHDNLAPTMSKLVIMNHVKEGIELARHYRLNPKIQDFIRQHHGNSLVYYFYRRALESLEEDQEITEEGFRYPGPKPDTKETAVVLLADSVEAATRALKEPTPANIEDTVHKIINNKFIDGQLDECDLTLKDLEKIAAVFTRLLGGIYHSRISYQPPENENQCKKPAKTNHGQPEKTVED